MRSYLVAIREIKGNIQVRSRLKDLIDIDDHSGSDNETDFEANGLSKDDNGHQQVPITARREEGMLARAVVKSSGVRGQRYAQLLRKRWYRGCARIDASSRHPVPAGEARVVSLRDSQAVGELYLGATLCST